jgi:hypothetical protein
VKLSFAEARVLSHASAGGVQSTTTGPS